MVGCPLGCYGYKRTGGANEINVQMMVYNLDTKPFWRSEVDEIEKVDDISKQLPWFLECNPDRYPYWWVFLRFKINIVMLCFFAGLGSQTQGTSSWLLRCIVGQKEMKNHLFPIMNSSGDDYLMQCSTILTSYASFILHENRKQFIFCFGPLLSAQSQNEDLMIPDTRGDEV